MIHSLNWRVLNDLRFHISRPAKSSSKSTKQELVNIEVKLFSLKGNERDDLMTQHAHLTKILFSYSIRLRKLLDAQNSTETARPTNGDSKRLETLMGTLFCISVHSRANQSSAEKLVYLQQALKGGPAQSTIEGLSRSGDNYEEAVRCLKAKYDHPRQIHQAHPGGPLFERWKWQGDP